MRWKNRLADSRGSALIETAVALPVLLLIVFAVARFAIAFNNYIVLTDSVRIGARSLAITRGIANPCQTAGSKAQVAATTLTSNQITLTAQVNGNTYTAAAGSIPQCSGQGVLMSAGGDAMLRATYPCAVVIYGINFVPSCMLTAQTTVRVE
jgi:Flp pilus assembly protein TadG